MARTYAADFDLSPLCAAFLSLGSSQSLMLAESWSNGNLCRRRRGGHLAGYDFTTGVRGALIKAREEAHRRNHEYVGTEHLLLGLLAEDDTLVMDVLENLGASAAKVHSIVDGMIEDGLPSTRSRIPDLPYTPRARVVL